MSEKIEENPYERFVSENVEFDKNGRAKLISAHGLARLLQRFHAELQTLLQDLEREAVRKFAKLLQVRNRKTMTITELEL